MKILDREVFQYAYVVNDLEAAAMRWIKLFGAGPFFIEPHHIMPEGCYTFRGGTKQCDVSYAFGYSGGVQIQLICQFDDTPSIFRDMYKQGEEGFHHVALLTKHFTEDKKALKAQGFTLATEMAEPSLKSPERLYEVAYFDARDHISGFVELYAAFPGPLAAFEMWKTAHETWDGKTDPIRSSR